jgi:regulatory protein
MALITGILASPKYQGRFIIEVEGAPAATVGLDTIDRLGLAIGREYDAVREQVEHDVAALKTFDRALNMLAVRARSRTELRRQLIAKGEPADHVDAALERLAANGLLDDAGYARQFARSKVLGPGHSRRRLQAELFRKGVSREIANDAIDDVMADEEVDADAIIERVARRKLRSLMKLDPEVRDRRLWEFLSRRGYDSDDIRRAIKTVTAEWPGVDLASQDDEAAEPGED